MTHPSAHLLPVTIPLTARNHQIADAFYQQHSDAQKAQQVYLNTLSIQAVHFYLSCLGIKTSLEKSQSWNLALQVLIDTADLWIENLGALECCLLMAEAGCVVSPQVLDQRIGYVVVRLNADLTEADLLGFVPRVETEQLFLEQLQSIEELPIYLNQLKIAKSVPTRLSDWFHTRIETGWKTLEMLLEDWREPALSFRMPTFEPQKLESAAVKRGKLLALGDAPEEQVLLLIEVAPTRAVSEYQITTELCPIGKASYLPRSLHLSVLDEEGSTVLQAASHESEGLEFQFSGELGEQFSIQIRLHDRTLIETFEI